MRSESPVSIRFESYIGGLAILVVVCLTGLYSPDMFPTIAESISIVIAFGAFMVAWNGRSLLDNDFLLVVGVASLFVGLLGGMSQLVVEGAGRLRSISQDVSAYFWLAEHGLAGLSYLAAALLVGRPQRLRPRTVFIIYLLVFAVMIHTLLTQRLPPVLASGSGLTALGAALRDFACLTFLVAAALLVRKRRPFDTKVAWLLVGAMLMSAAESGLTQWSSQSGLLAILPLLCDIIASYLLYTAIVVTGVSRPHYLLFRELKEAEQRYRDLFEYAPAMYVTTRIEHGLPVIVDVNSQFLSTLGYKKEDVLGRPLTDIYTPESRALAEAAGYRGTPEPTSPPLERQLMTRDGHVVTVVLRTKPGHVADPTGAGSRAMFVDITALTQAHAKLHESEERYRALVELSPDAVFVRKQGIITFANAAAVRLLGARSAQDLIGRNAIDFIHPDYRESVIERMRLVRAGQDVPSQEQKYVRLDGTVVDVEVAATRFIHQGETVSQIVVHDITEARRAKEAEREQRLMAEALRDTAAALSGTLDSEEVLDRIMANVGRVVPHDGVHVILIQNGYAVTVRALESSGSAAHAPLVHWDVPIDQVHSFSQILRSGEALVIPNVREYEGWVDQPGQEWVQSCLTAPIRYRGVIVGFLALISSTLGYFTQTHAERLQAFADQVGVAIWNARSYEESRRQTARAETLARVAARLNAHLDQQAILDAVCEAAATVLEVPTATVALTDASTGACTIAAAWGSSASVPPIGTAVPRAPIDALAASQSSVEAVRDVRSIVGPEAVFDPAGFGVRSYAMALMRHNDEIIGTLNVATTDLPREFAQADLDLLVGIANQTALAVANARLFQAAKQELAERERAERKLARHNRLHAVLTQTNEVIARARGAHELFQQACRIAVDVGGFTVAWIGMLDDEGWVRPQAHWGSEQDLWRHVRQVSQAGAPEYEGPTERALRTGECSRWNAEEGRSAGTSREHAARPGCQAIAAFPLQMGRRVVGALTLYAAEPGYFGDEEVELLTALATDIAFAIGAVEEEHRRQRAEAALAEERQLLARRVAERTAELRAANAELARAAHLKDEFLAAMSHELRTPLNTILVISEAMEEGVYGQANERQTRSLALIQESGHHLLALINDILDLSKIEAGKLALNPGTVDVPRICQASLEFVRQSARKKKIELASVMDESVPAIEADARRVKQILVNLLDNAVKFTPAGGTVGLEVHGDRDRGVVDLTVWDTGIGIAPNDIRRLFQPFVQLDSGYARQHEGTGLGLALVRDLVDLHQGSISVESEPGRGSRFTISLPWRLATYGSGQAPESSAAGASGGQAAGARVHEASHPGAVSAGSPAVAEPAEAPISGPRVLLVEDNESGLTALTDYLEATGCIVVAVKDGRQAYDRALDSHPDVVLMDVQLPGMDGLEVIRRIRGQAGLVSLPIIALTALAMPGDRERCLDAGADDYLPKPVNLHELSATIDRVTGPRTRAG